MSQIYGYVCVSNTGQSEELQIGKMTRLSIVPENIYIDKLEKGNSDRLQYRILTSKMQEGDLLYVTALDRLGRTYIDVEKQWDFLVNGIGVDVCIIDAPLVDTRKKQENSLTPDVKELIGQVLTSIAQGEKLRMKEPQTKGIQKALENGVKFGRPEIEVPEDFVQIVRRFQHKDIEIDKALALAGMSKATFYRNIRRMGLQGK